MQQPENKSVTGQSVQQNHSYGQSSQQAGPSVIYGQPIHQPQPTMAYSSTGVPVQLIPQPGMTAYTVPGTVHQAPMYVYAPPQPYAIDQQALDLQYQTCCCHVTTSVYVIGILESIGLIISLIVAIIQYQQFFDTYYYTVMVGCAISFVLGLIVLPPMFYGVYKEKAALLLPHIVFQSLVLMACACGAIVYVIYAAAIGYGGFYSSDIFGGAMAIFVVLIVIFLGVMGFEIFSVMQVVRCYRYLAVKTRSIW